MNATPAPPVEAPRLAIAPTGELLAAPDLATIEQSQLIGWHDRDAARILCRQRATCAVCATPAAPGHDPGAIRTGEHIVIGLRGATSGRAVYRVTEVMVKVGLVRLARVA